MSDMEDQDLERLKKACEGLSEHFDSVHIFATRHEPVEGGTVNANWGVGNWFARYGQVRTWLIKRDAGSDQEERDNARCDD